MSEQVEDAEERVRRYPARLLGIYVGGKGEKGHLGFHMDPRKKITGSAMACEVVKVCRNLVSTFIFLGHGGKKVLICVLIEYCEISEPGKVGDEPVLERDA